jgi:mRNA interferase RelE/StbE
MTKRYKVIWTKKGLKSLKRLDKNIGKDLAKKADELLSLNPHSGKPLLGVLKGHRRCRLDDYRIIYRIEETRLVILVIKAGHRRDIYKEFVNS